MVGLIITSEILTSQFYFIFRFFITIVSIGCVIYLLKTTNHYSNLYSLFGLLGFVFIATILSKYPSKVFT